MKTKLFFILSALWASTILALGAWWLYLIVSYGEKIELLAKHAQVETDGVNIIRMVKWEGFTFLILLLLLSATLLTLYLKDQRKNKAMTAFFAGLTHELKTPLASIRLQSDVLSELIDDLIEDQSKKKLISQHTFRLAEDTQKLENQMDKILQLSRIERGGDLDCVPVNLVELIKHTSKKWAPNLNINFGHGDSIKRNPQVWADEFALELILRNLFENTIQHTTNRDVQITLDKQENKILLKYEDSGEFEGKVEKLGELFYKYQSAKGSGIGLYLVSKLMNKMNGRFQVTKNGHLLFLLTFNEFLESENQS